MLWSLPRNLKLRLIQFKVKVNYQSWLQEMGLTVAYGLVPPNNVTDIPLSAWYDMLTDSDSSLDSSADLFVQASGAESALLVLPKM